MQRHVATCLVGSAQRYGSFVGKQEETSSGIEAGFLQATVQATGAAQPIQHLKTPRQLSVLREAASENRGCDQL